jgi:hypothetical protein
MIPCEKGSLRLIKFQKGEDQNKIQKDFDIVINKFEGNDPVCLSRAGDSELRILKGYNKLNPSKEFRIRLAKSMYESDIPSIGISYSKTSKKFEQTGNADVIKWVNKLLKVDFSYDEEKIVSAFLIARRPDILGQVTYNKRVLWINFEAYKFSELIKNKEYCYNYSLNINESHSINIPDGKGGIVFGNKSRLGVLNKVEQELKDKQGLYDIAVVGAGVMGGPICLHIRDKYKKQAIDVGSLLSGMRGQRNRRYLKKNGWGNCLVWGGNSN